jgi:hypothetical protein
MYLHVLILIKMDISVLLILESYGKNILIFKSIKKWLICYGSEWDIQIKAKLLSINSLSSK